MHTRLTRADRHTLISVVTSTGELLELPTWGDLDRTFHLLLGDCGDVTLHWDGLDVSLTEGRCVLIRPVDAGRVRFAMDGRVIALTFPASIIETPLPRLEAALAQAIDVSDGVSAVFATLLRSLIDTSVTATNNQVAFHLSDAVTSLLAATLIESDDDPVMPRADATLLAARRWIEEHLNNPDLGINAVASANHVSVSYLQKLFASDGESVSGWVRERRCERCRRDLADPSQRDVPIAAIARRWGFASPAHFSRLFVKHYGISPRDYRRSALRKDSPHPSDPQRSLRGTE